MKKRFTLFAALFLGTLLFTASCNNVFESSADDYEYDEKEAEKKQAERAKKSAKEKEEAAAPKIRYASLSGELALDGAYPHSIKQKVEDIGLDNPENVPSESSDPSRAALPSIPNNSVYYVIAKATGKTSVKGEVNQSTKTYKIEKLEIGNFTWTIEAGIKESEAENAAILLMDTYPLNLSETNFSDTNLNQHNFILKPLQDDGTGTSTGKVLLQMKLPAVADDNSADKIRKVRTECVSDSETVKTQWGNPEVTISDNLATLDISSIKIGSYDVVFSFYNSESDLFPSFTTVQTINVFKNLTTNAWADGSSSDNDRTGVISGNTFEITSAILQTFSATQLYVGNPGTYGEGLPGKQPDDSNDGGPYSPLASFGRALQIISDQKRSNNFTIHVSETQRGFFVIPSSVTTVNAASITIEGVAGRSAELNGNNQYSVLAVDSDIPVVLKNITITNGRGHYSDRGGGLYLADNANVTISDGVVITGNTASGKGGAVYVSPTATFNIKGNARIPYGTGNDVYLARDDLNDVQAAITVTGALTSSSEKVATITSEGWKRGSIGLKAGGVISDINPYTGRFDFTANGFNWNYKSSEPLFCKLQAPIYVASYANGGREDNSGLQDSPFDTIEHALRECRGGEPYSISIIGEIQENIDLTSTNLNITDCTELTLIGNTSDSTIRAAVSGSVIKVDTPVPLKIQNLKITGGTGTSISPARRGGGIYLKSGTVTLADGAHITGNSATHGGGVFIESAGTLYMYGSSLIGDKKGGSYTAAPTGDAQASNYANAGPGGGIYSAGNVFIGYERWASDTDYSTKDMTEGYGILHNYAGTSGGGIMAMGGIFKMASGTIGINRSGFDGGGAYNSGSADCVFAGGKIEENVSPLGGAIYVNLDKTVELKSNVEIKNNEATTAGGAVYVAGSLKIQDSVSIPYGVNGSQGEKKNDVYLAEGKTINLSGSFDSTAPATVAVVTPASFTRGTKLLSSASAIDDNTKAKFKLTSDDSDWDKVNKSESSVNYVCINSPIYVAPVSGTVPSGFGNGKTSGATGTKSSPYASVAAALGCSELSLADNTITIAGTLNGAQTISGTVPDSLTLKGYIAEGDTSSGAKIDAGGASGAGSALGIDASGKTVTIQDLTITGGNAENGGGINLAAGTVTLTNGANIVGNQATNGGGVYLAGSGSTLYLKGSAVIGDKIAYTAKSSTINLNPTSETNSGCANKADNGGGIYCNGGNVYVGCDSEGLNTTISLATAGGLRRNYAGNGGGVYIADGTFMTASGQISYNWASSGAGLYVADGVDHKIAGTVDINNNKAGNEGGGLYIGSGSTVSMSGSAKIEKNSAVSGGGVSLLGTLNMSEGTIGGDSPDLGNTASSGGGVNIGVGSSSPYPCGTFNMSGGTISYNSCSNNGGGVSISSRTPSSTTYNGTFSMSGGIISNNTASANGGAVLQFGKFNISGSASIPYGVTIDGTTTKSPKYNDVYLFRDTNTITVASSSLSGGTSVATVTPTAWKRGTNIIEWKNDVTFNPDQKSAIKGKIQLSKDNDGWTRRDTTVSGINYVYITSPVYVVDANDPDNTGKTRPEGFGKGLTSGANGTREKPYASISDALGCSELSLADNTITVAGTLTGKQEITTAPSGVTVLTLRGYKPDSNSSSATLDAKQAAGANTLLINKSGLLVKIYDLTIKGGYANGNSGGSETGGGIKLSSGNLFLSEGVHVTENYAQYGGGVSVSSGTKLIIGKGAEIGSSSTSKNTAQYQGGGVYNNGGAVYIGYKLNPNNNPVADSTATDCYIHYNSVTQTSSTESTYGGAGLYIGSSATVNHAYGTISDNSAQYGAGAYVADGTFNLLNNGEIYNNSAITSAGGVFIASGAKLSMEGGKINKNSAGLTGGGIANEGTFIFTSGSLGEAGELNSANSSNPGGAMVNAGTFNLGASAVIAADATHDIYITDKKGSSPAVPATITLTGDRSNTDKIVLNPQNLNRGAVVFDGNTSYLNTTNFNKFSLKGDTSNEWSFRAWPFTSPTSGVIDADIYVTGSGASDSYTGTASKPYSTINKAISQCWEGNTTVKVKGTIQASSASNLQKITTAPSVNPITLSGSDSATIDGNKKGTAFTVDANVTLIIQNITFTKGKNTNGNGGGILINNTSADVRLGTGVVVDDNEAECGGGIYNKGKLSLSGNALIGKTGDTVADSSTYGNKSSSDGAGIYNATNAYLYVGYTEPAGDKTDSSYSGGIRRNYNAANGGGIYNDGNLYIYKGEIACNQGRNGGGIYLGSGMTMSGGKINGNKAGTSGGGIYHNTTGSVTISDGEISGNTGTGITCVNTTSHSIQMTGGKICKNTSRGVFMASGTSFLMSGTASIGDKSDTDSGNGLGGVDTGGGYFYLGWTDASHPVDSMTGGIFNHTGNITQGAAINNDSGHVNLAAGEISGNVAKTSGGAVYNGNELRMRGSIYIPGDGTEKNNDIYVAYNKLITLDGTLSQHNKDDQINVKMYNYDSLVSLFTSSTLSNLSNNLSVIYFTPYTDNRVFNLINNGMYNYKYRYISGDGPFYCKLYVDVDKVTKKDDVSGFMWNLLPASDDDDDEYNIIFNEETDSEDVTILFQTSSDNVVLATFSTTPGQNEVLMRYRVLYDSSYSYNSVMFNSNYFESGWAGCDLDSMGFVFSYEVDSNPPDISASMEGGYLILRVKPNCYRYVIGEE